VIKFNLPIFCSELSRIPSIVYVIISKIVLKQDLMFSGRALPKHCFIDKTRYSPLSCVFRNFGS